MVNDILIPNLHKLREYVDDCVDNFKTQKAPLIGVSCNHADGNSMVRDLYIDSLLQAGAVPVMIPVITDPAALATIVDRIDGVLFTGGGDVLPMFVGEEPHPALGDTDPKRDQFDFTLLKLCADRCMPIMGICRGHQVINLYFGGVNYQDIKSLEQNVIQHSQKSGKEFVSHTVDLSEGSVLKKMFGKEFLRVNSFHHQAVKQVADGFVETALSADGINEGMEAMPIREIYSVQWHPEGLIDSCDSMLPLFEYLNRQAKLYRRAKEFHRHNVSIDSHCDTPMKFEPGMNIGLKLPNTDVDLQKMSEGGLDGVIMAAYMPQRERDETSLEKMPQKTIEVLSEIQRQIAMNSSVVGQARCANDIYRLKREGKKAIFLGIENGYAIGNDLANIERFKDMGVVYITLCHNGDNDICDSCKGNSEHCGLSDFGERCVREMNRLGVMVDISHAADQTVRDVLAVSEAPIIASHSSARALCSHRRNLPYDLIRAIANRDGVVQVTIYNEFVKDEPGATIQDYIAHINHVVNIAGIDHVGIGTDFDGGDGIIGLQNSSDLIAITMELFKEGYTEDEVAKIWGGNLLRVMDQVQRVAEV